MLCEFYPLAEVVSRTRAPDPAARAPFAAEAADALEAFPRRRGPRPPHPGGEAAKGGAKAAAGGANVTRGRRGRTRWPPGFDGNAPSGPGLEELESTRRRRAEEALLNADWDDEGPGRLPGGRGRGARAVDAPYRRRRRETPDNVAAHLARELEMIAARDELAGGAT